MDFGTTASQWPLSLLSTPCWRVRRGFRDDGVPASSLSSLHAVLASTAWIWLLSSGVGSGHNRGRAGMDGDDADHGVGAREPIKKRVGGPSSWAALFLPLRDWCSFEADRRCARSDATDRIRRAVLQRVSAPSPEGCQTRVAPQPAGLPNKSGTDAATPRGRTERSR